MKTCNNSDVVLTAHAAQNIANMLGVQLLSDYTDTQVQAALLEGALRLKMKAQAARLFAERIARDLGDV